MTRGSIIFNNKDMKWNNALDEVLGSKLKIRVLRHLSRGPGPYTGRDLARASGYSHTQTYKALAELETLGVITRQHAGTSYLYSLDKGNYIVSHILLPAIEAERQLIAELAGRFYTGLGQDLISVVLFGSVARRADDPDSDIDFILVVRDGSDLDSLEETASEVCLEAAVEFGGSVSAFAFTESEYDRKLMDGKAMWKDIKAEGIEMPRPSREDASVE
ncbi:MAG: helix-turn-helix domain-containing protein [Actinomycetia bacterium]|nr:helix-turn-helix domain-containing protein [Actinomycetes bacterium]